MSTYKDKIAVRWYTMTKPSIYWCFLDIIIITSVPFVSLLLNQDWTYTRYTNLDEWMYVGYGYNYLDPAFYATNYKISRLPWVLTEALIRGFFSPLVSSWILGFSVLALGNIALYFALKFPFGRLPAVFAAIFIGGLTFMHANGGADYHNTLAGAFYCVAMLFCSRCARQQLPLRDLVFFGASLALSIHTNPLFVNLAPILFAQYLLCYRVNHLKFPPILAGVFLMAVGAVGVTIILCVINLSAGRQFLFFEEQFKLVSSFIADSSLQKTWWEPWSSGWFWAFPYAGIFFAGTLLSLATILIAAPLRSLSARHAYSIIFSAAYLCALLVWVLWQTKGQTALQPPYFAFPLGFPLSGAVAAAMATSASRNPKAWPLTVASIFFAIVTVVAIHFADRVVEFARVGSFSVSVQAALAYGVAFAILILVRSSSWFVPLAALALSAANAIGVFARADYTANTCTVRRDAYEAIIDAANVLRKTHIAGNNVFTFADDGERFSPGAGCDSIEEELSSLHVAIAAEGDFRYLAPSWFKQTLETVAPERWKEIVATKGVIGFLTYNPARINLLREKVEAAGGTPGDVGFFKIHEGNLELPLYVLPIK